jgi:ferredoxin--NADP+ reductase
MDRHGDELWDLLNQPASRLYVCGVRGMEGAVEEMFEKQARKQAQDWSELRERLMQGGRLRISTY